VALALDPTINVICSILNQTNMYQDKITLDHALQLESEGLITIIDGSPSSIDPLGDLGEQWKQNFATLRSKARHISQDKLLTYYNAKYLIESFQGWQDSSTCSWRYLHGIPNANIAEHTKDNVEYVYILVNDGYPGLVKIGATITEVLSRVDGINSSGIVNEWKAKFALPLQKGSAFKVETALHRAFADKRVKSSEGRSREFFSVDSLTALDKLREVGALFQVGNPIVY
jgi:hypothetical protein